MSVSKKAAESLQETISDDSLWTEWSDVQINKENWGIPKNGSDGMFLDTQVVQLPSSLKPHAWIRAKNLQDLSEPVILYVTSSEDHDFISNNKHLLHSEFVRWFISTLINLRHCGRDGLEISGENGNFTWNCRDQAWHGWMNVYSMNKVGKGVQHRPAINVNGKYVVRLYFMGAWRRILVDDLIPVDEKNVPLLPRTSFNFELYPMLLSKALLKLASLTWTSTNEIMDFHPVTCLTGWTCVQLNISYLSPQDKWDFIGKYAEHFECQPEVEQATQETDFTKSRKSKDRKMSKETLRTGKSKDTDRTDATKKTKGGISKLEALVKPQPVILFLGLEDMKDISSEDVPELAPCLSHFIYVTQSRDVPLDPKDVKPPLARWKLYRWLKWAINEGIIDPVEYFLPIRSLKIVSPLKRCEESIINNHEIGLENEETISNIDRNNKSKMEQTDLKSTHSDKSKDLPKFISEETDLCFWADFNKMEPFVKDVQFFYKLDYFQYTVKLSDRFAANSIDQKSDAKRKSEKGSRKSSPSKTMLMDPKFVDTYAWPQEMTKTRNEPLYLLTDSMEPKFFLINFSTCQLSAETFEETNKETQTTFVKTMLKARRNCLNVEKHNWFRRPEKSNSLVAILTAGTKSNVLEIDRGRHLLRLYCYSEFDCFTSISSDTIFHIGDRRRMYQLMSTESETIDYIAKHISNTISLAYQSFGTQKFLESLKNYYKSYQPPVKEFPNANKQFYNQIHDYFIEEEILLIRKIMPEKDVPDLIRSLRIFFLNPTIGLECFNPIAVFLKSLRDLHSNKLEDGKTITSQDSEGQKNLHEERAATIIQSYFKMFIVKKYKRIHNSKHMEHQPILENLLKIADLFNYNKRESLANQLLRNTLKHHDKLYDIYPCSKDFEHTLQVQELKGILSHVRPNQWLPIVRLVVNPQIGETVLASVDLFVALPKYSVRVFKNETCQEMLRAVNNVVPTRYPYTQLGYTIFCYGWSENQMFRELPYSLNIITMKGQPMFQFLRNEISLPSITMPPVLSIEELSNSYIPNSRNLVSKWIVRIVKSCVVSFRLKTSYENVKMRFSVINEENQVLAQVEGTSIVILPMVYLEFVKKEDRLMPRSNDNADGDSNNQKNVEDGLSERKVDADGDRSNEELNDHMRYHVEALILEDSWPLTRTEWSLVSEFQVKPTGSLIKTRIPPSWSTSKLSRIDSAKSKGEMSRLKKGSKQSLESVSILESPYWVLQVVTDSDSGLKILQDRTKEKQIARMKAIWAEENPDSLERGRELRETFLKKHEIQPKSSSYSVEQRFSSLSARSSSKRSSHRTSIVDISTTSMVSLEERTLKAPPSLRRLPPLDLSNFEEEGDLEEQPFVRTTSQEEMLKDLCTMQVVQAEENYENFLKDLQKLMEKQGEYYKTFYGYYDDSFLDRRADLEILYEARNAYVNSTKFAPAQSSTKSATFQKSKASKKT